MRYFKNGFFVSVKSEDSLPVYPAWLITISCSSVDTDFLRGYLSSCSIVRSGVAHRNFDATAVFPSTPLDSDGINVITYDILPSGICVRLDYHPPKLPNSLR